MKVATLKRLNLCETNLSINGIGTIRIVPSLQHGDTAKESITGITPVITVTDHVYLNTVVTITLLGESCLTQTHTIQTHYHGKRKIPSVLIVITLVIQQTITCIAVLTTTSVEDISDGASASNS